MTEDEYVRPIHPLRWRLLAVWIILFTGITFYIINQNRRNIAQIKDNGAKVTALARTNKSLRHTNCTLQKFLVQARDTRIKAALNDKDPQVKRADLRAANSYDELARAFNGTC